MRLIVGDQEGIAFVFMQISLPYESLVGLQIDGLNFWQLVLGKNQGLIVLSDYCYRIECDFSCKVFCNVACEKPFEADIFEPCLKLKKKIHKI